MMMKKTKNNYVLKLTRKEFNTLMAALDTISEGTDGGAYMDVLRLYDKILSALHELNYGNHSANDWVAGK